MVMAELLNLTQAAKLAGVSRGTIYRAIRTGALTAASGGRPGRLTLIEPEILRAWCDREGLRMADLPARQESTPSPPFDPATIVQGQLQYFVEWVESSIGHANDRLMERLERTIEASVERAVARAMAHYEQTERWGRSGCADRSIQTDERAQRSLAGLTPSHLTKAQLLTRIRAMHQSLSYQAIADRLNAEGIPTLSGKGRWQKGTISNLLTPKR
jgi:excisionase family DNA binding protein